VINTEDKNECINFLIDNVANWHHQRNLVDGANNFSQFTKLIEKAGELAGNISRGKDCKDDIGDMVVVLINICERQGYTLQECLETAWNDIKDRKGMMINGTFVKEADL
jgi:NTP pyrophosphatase (non-canonical NTP hydrolase)